MMRRCTDSCPRPRGSFRGWCSTRTPSRSTWRAPRWSGSGSICSSSRACPGDRVESTSVRWRWTRPPSSSYNPQPTSASWCCPRDTRSYQVRSQWWEILSSEDCCCCCVKPILKFNWQLGIPNRIQFFSISICYSGCMNNITSLSAQDSSRQSTCPGTRSASTAPPPSASRRRASAGGSTRGRWTGGWWPRTPTASTPPAWRAPPSASTSWCSPSTSGARSRSCGPPARRTCPASTAWRSPWSGPCCSATWAGGEPWQMISSGQTEHDKYILCRLRYHQGGWAAASAGSRLGFWTVKVVPGLMTVIVARVTLWSVEMLL